MKNIEEKIENQKKAIKLFQYLLNNYDNPQEVIKELEEEILACKAAISDLQNAGQEVEVDLVAKTIMHEKKKLKLQPRERFLLEELLQEKMVHWSVGFMLFDGWQKKVPDNGPVEQFRGPVSNINKILPGEEKVIKSMEKNGATCWMVNEDVQVKGSIQKCDDILRTIDGNGSILDELQKCKEALKQHPGSINANKLLVELLIKLKKKHKGTDKEWNRYIIDAETLFRNKERKMRVGYKAISQFGSKNKWDGYWQEVIPYQWINKNKLMQIRYYHKAAKHLRADSILDKDQEKLFDILESIRLIHILSQDEKNTEKCKTEIAEFMKEKIIVESIRIASGKEKQWAFDCGVENVTSEDLRPLSYIALLEAIKSDKSLLKGNYKKSNHLKTYLINIIRPYLRDQILMEKGSVPEDKVRDVWALLNAEKRFQDKIRRKPSFDELQKEINIGKNNWSREKLQGIYFYITKLRGFIDIDDVPELSGDQRDNYQYDN